MILYCALPSGWTGLLDRAKSYDYLALTVARRAGNYKQLAEQAMKPYSERASERVSE